MVGLCESPSRFAPLATLPPFLLHQAITHASQRVNPQQTPMTSFAPPNPDARPAQANLLLPGLRSAGLAASPSCVVLMPKKSRIYSVRALCDAGIELLRVGGSTGSPILAGFFERPANLDRRPPHVLAAGDLSSHGGTPIPLYLAFVFR